MKEMHSAELNAHACRALHGLQDEHTIFGSRSIVFFKNPVSDFKGQFMKLWFWSIDAKWKKRPILAKNGQKWRTR